MDLETLAKYAAATNEAHAKGFLGRSNDKKFLITFELFMDMVIEHNLMFFTQKHAHEHYPYEASFVHQGITYLVLLNQEQSFLAGGAPVHATN